MHLRESLKIDAGLLLFWFLFLPAFVLSTTTICPVICPHNPPSPHITVNEVSDEYQIILSTDNCPVLNSSDDVVCLNRREAYIPKNPQVLDTPYPIGISSPLGLSIGLLKNGVLLYGPADKLGTNMMLSELEDYDECMAMVDDNGVYRSRGLYVYYNGNIDDYDAELCDLPSDYVWAHSPSIGWMWDGYEIFGRWNGQYANIPLDECGGHEHELPNNASGYHYHMTLEYPYTIDCFHGCPNNMNNPSILIDCKYETPTSEPISASKTATWSVADISAELLVILAVSVACCCCVCIAISCLSGSEEEWQWSVQRKPRWVHNNPQFRSPRSRQTSERQRMINSPQDQRDEQFQEEYLYRPDTDGRWEYKNVPAFEEFHQEIDTSGIPTYPRFRELPFKDLPDPTDRPNAHLMSPALQEAGPPQSVTFIREQERVMPHSEKWVSTPRDQKNNRDRASESRNKLKLEKNRNIREWTPLDTNSYKMSPLDKHNREWTPLPELDYRVADNIHCIGKGKCEVFNTGIR